MPACFNSTNINWQTQISCVFQPAFVHFSTLQLFLWMNTNVTTLLMVALLQRIPVITSINVSFVLYIYIYAGKHRYPERMADFNKTLRYLGVGDIRGGIPILILKAKRVLVPVLYSSFPQQ